MATYPRSFVCDALGSMYEYRCDFSDQMAFLMLSHANAPGILACRSKQEYITYELQGKEQPWRQVEHTADQVQVVNRAFVALRYP